MNRTKQIVSGVFIGAFGLLGIYCALRAVQVYHDLGGQPDIEDSGRNWSTGATACLLACAVVATFARKKREAIASGSTTFRWWRSALGLTVIAAVGVVVVVVGSLVFRDVLKPPPMVRTVQTISLPAPPKGLPVPASGPLKGP